MKNYLKTKKSRGEGYVDLCVAVLVLSFVLLLCCASAALISRGRTIASAADRIAEAAALAGRTDLEDAVGRIIADTGLSLTVSFEGTDYLTPGQKVQLGHEIAVTVRGEGSLPLFLGLSVPVPLEAATVTSSRVYWKGEGDDP
ncbi:MAG: DUF4320 family protein [Clostridia bacterium]|nr:DUF4320 family protein [Clostridia bacterium]